MANVQIVPAILTSNPAEVKQKLQLLDGVSDRVHIDVIDGVFAKNKTIDPSILGNLETDIAIDFHVMTKSPIDWVEKCIRGGADRIIAQIETMHSQLEFFARVQSVSVKVGLAIDLATPVEKIDKDIIRDVDVMLVMGVPAGFGGQTFDTSCIEKIKKLDYLRKGDPTPYRICADGGETIETIDDVVAAGADEVVVGKRLFEGDIAENIAKFAHAAEIVNKWKINPKR
jgi:ribulose-phosphate 3-epimerase